MNKSFFLIIFACLLLSGCANTVSYPMDDGYHFETDAQYMLFPSGMERVFAQSEEGYYFDMLIGSKVFMFFADKKNMKPVPVCNKPNCLHYEETDEERRNLCTANIPGLLSRATLFFNNGQLYIPEYNGPNEIVLMQYAPDGSSKKQFVSLGGEESFGNCMVFHRGYFYVEINSLDEEQNAVSRIWKYSVDNPGKKRECIFETVSEGGYIMDLQAFGGRLYFFVFADGAKKLYTLELSNNKVEKICDIADVNDAGGQLSILNNQLLFKLNHKAPDKALQELSATMYTADLDGGNVQKWRDSFYCNFVADGQYVYEWDDPLEGVTPCVRIYDVSGNLLVNYNLAEKHIPCMTVYATPGEHVFLFHPKSIYYFSKSEISSGIISPKLLMERPN